MTILLFLWPITVAKKKRNKFLRLRKPKKMTSDFDEILGQWCIQFKWYQVQNSSQSINYFYHRQDCRCVKIFYVAKNSRPADESINDLLPPSAVITAHWIKLFWSNSVFRPSSYVESLVLSRVHFKLNFRFCMFFKGLYVKSSFDSLRRR